MKLRNTLLILLAFLLASSLIMPASFAHAQENNTTRGRNNNRRENVQQQNTSNNNEDTTASPLQTLINRFTAPEPAAQTATTSPAPEPASTSTPVATSTTTPAAPATTTPATPPEDPVVPVVPAPEDRNTSQAPTINKGVEDVLNQILTPETPIKENNPVKTPAKATSTPALPTKNTKATTTATTTPAAGTTNNSINGGSNSFAPNNYYIPLDNLSPEITYALSFVAMVLGIAGAVLIIRDPSKQSEAVWAPTAGFSREPLLEP